MAQASEIQQFTEHCRKLYRDTLCGPTKRIERGEVLFKQFEEEAAALLAKPSGDDRALAERVNEIAVAKILADDPTITGKITYEPNILPSGRKIDFVVERENDNLYVEVKTVHPRKADTEAAWQLYLDRRPNHQPSAEFHVEKEWMGGAIYGNTFASRSRFLEYTLDFEVRLAEAKEIKAGPGILVFCGTGFPWHLSNLEDFVDFYRVGTHRQDDPFALMELHHIEHEKLSLLRNIDHFAFLRRATEQGKITSFEWPVRGPKFGGPIAPPKVANEMPMADDNLPADPVRPPHVSVRRRKKAASKKAPKGFAKKAAKKTMKKLSKKTAKTSSAKKRSAKAWKPTAGRKAVATKKTAKKKKARKSRRW